MCAAAPRCPRSTGSTTAARAAALRTVAAAAAAARSGHPSRNPDAPRVSGTAEAAGPCPATAPGTQALAPAGRGAAAPTPPAAAGRGAPESPRTPAPPAPGPAGTPPRAPAPGQPRPGAPLVLPQPHRGRQTQTRGFLARIGHAHGIIPTPLPTGAHQRPAGVRAGGLQPHCGRDTSCPAPAAQICACPLRHTAPISGI